MLNETFSVIFKHRASLGICVSAQLSILKAQKRVVNVKAQKDWILRE